MYVPQSFIHILFWESFNTPRSTSDMTLPSVLMRPYPMILVPGSIPRMIFGAFCKEGLILWANRLLEQKYQINHQLLVGPAPLCVIVVEPLQADHAATRTGERWSQVKLSWMDLRFWMVVGLMFVNWAIESVKWQKQLEPCKNEFYTGVPVGTSRLQYYHAYPNRIGEYAGRILYINEENRIRAIPLTILGSISQLAVTMSAGTAGILYIRYGSGILDALPEQPWFLNGFILVLGFCPPYSCSFCFSKCMIWSYSYPASVFEKLC